MRTSEHARLAVDGACYGEPVLLGWHELMERTEREVQISMATVKVISVVRAAEPEDQSFKFSIDRPQTGGAENGRSILLEGWCFTAGDKVELIRLGHEGRILKRLPVGLVRDDVAGLYPKAKRARAAGFRGYVGTVGLPTEATIVVDAKLESGNHIRIAEITLRHDGIDVDSSGNIQPLMLTALGRCGTTWVMRLLSQPPRILIHDQYPYELRTAAYWMHMLQLGSAPANLDESAHPDSFFRKEFFSGSNPYYQGPTIDNPGLDQWFAETYTADLAAFAVNPIEIATPALTVTDTNARLSKADLVRNITETHNDLLCEN